MVVGQNPPSFEGTDAPTLGHEEKTKQISWKGAYQTSRTANIPAAEARAVSEVLAAFNSGFSFSDVLCPKQQPQDLVSFSLVSVSQSVSPEAFPPSSGCLSSVSDPRSKIFPISAT